MKNKQIFIIEHLEKDLYPWCVYEYKHISKIVGKNNLWFTNINKKDSYKLSKYGQVFNKSVSKLNIKNACVLDPESSSLLTPRKARKINFFIFGGILGDYPPRKRTKEELTRFLKFKSYNIGKKQFSTDNAVYVVNQITKGKNLRDLKFQDKIEIKINKIESIELPYLYNIVNNKPLISKEVISYLKRKKDF